MWVPLEPHQLLRHSWRSYFWGCSKQPPLLEIPLRTHTHTPSWGWHNPLIFLSSTNLCIAILVGAGKFPFLFHPLLLSHTKASQEIMVCGVQSFLPKLINFIQFSRKEEQTWSEITVGQIPFLGPARNYAVLCRLAVPFLKQSASPHPFSQRCLGTVRGPIYHGDFNASNCNPTQPTTHP